MTDRAPDYPNLSFPEALQRARLLYDRERMSPASREVVARHIGYQAFSGAAKQAVAALKKYGLVSGRGDQYRLTEEARQALLLPENDLDRNIILRRLAFLPELWSDIQNHFGDDAPSETNLRSFLIKRGFNERLAKDVARFYYATAEFIEGIEGPELSDLAKPNMEETGSVVLKSQDKSPVASDQESNNWEERKGESHVTKTQLRFKLSPTCQAEIFLYGEADEAAWDRLTQFIQLTKGASV